MAHYIANSGEIQGEAKSLPRPRSKKAFCSQNARAERGCDSNNFLTRECASPGGLFCFIGIAKQFPIKQKEQPPESDCP